MVKGKKQGKSTQSFRKTLTIYYRDAVLLSILVN